MTRVEEFRLPDLGEGLTEAELVSWAVRAGDTVDLNEVIGEVETAKALVELPSPCAGVVRELLARPGEIVPVGAVLVRFEAAGSSDAGPVAAPVARRGADADAGSGSVLVGYGPSRPAASRRRRRTQSPPNPPHPPSSPGLPRSAPGVDAVPAARHLAGERGLDLNTITGTGRSGAVTVADVEHAPFPADLPAPTNRETRTPIQGVRRRTAAAMVASVRTAPQVTEFLTVDVTETVRLLARLRETRAFADLHPTPLVVVAKAVLALLPAHPSLNSTWCEDTGEIVTHHHVDLGIATATDRGLVVPNVADAERLTLPDLCRAVETAVSTARAGRSTPADLTGGTFTITNIGVYGVDAGTPILNPGQAAILALGAIGRRPWVIDDQLAVREVTTLSLTVDHRLVDGEQASRFLADLGSVLTDPAPGLLAHL